MNDREETVVKVLVIDDNPGDARLIQEALGDVRGERYQVDWADKVSTGMELLASDTYDLVLVDLIIPPESRGLITFQRIQAQAPDVPKIVLTSWDDEEMAAQAVRDGAQDYIIKGTLDARSLVRAVRYALERQRLLGELRELSLTDELTGLHNRRGFQVLAAQQLKVAVRTRQELLLFYVDLDGMKKINDTYGHAEGDRALRGAAAVLRGTFRESDIVARLGGDEFAALSFAATEQSAAGLQARLLWRLDDFNAEERLPYQLSLSYGFTRFYPEEPATLEELMARADRDLYDRKRTQKDARPEKEKHPRGEG